jgi:hypothetical protein
MSAANFSACQIHVRRTLKTLSYGILFAFPKMCPIMKKKQKQGVLEFKKDAFCGMRLN